MFNPYSIILGLFVFAGMVTIFWGLRVMVKARKTLQWPVVEGTIEASAVSSNANDLLPEIKYCYQIGNQTYRRSLEFSRDITPSEELSRSYTEKYPVNSRVQVYYDPEEPSISTLEPGAGKGDWLILAIGLVMLAMGIMFLTL